MSITRKNYKCNNCGHDRLILMKEFEMIPWRRTVEPLKYEEHFTGRVAVCESAEQARTLISLRKLSQEE